jgi:Holliday junction DNA helicase RuvA
MISSLAGTLATSSALRAEIEVQGVTYEVLVPTTTAERLPAPGAKVRLHTCVIYREDSQTLYGFLTPEDRDFFRLLIEQVSGVGPKLALTLLSRLPRPNLEAAIRSGDVTVLAKCQGIGKKTAERLVLELRGKLGSAVSGDGAVPPALTATPPRQDAVAALLALGYKVEDAEKAVGRAAARLGPDAATESLVRQALAG